MDAVKDQEIALKRNREKGREEVAVKKGRTSTWSQNRSREMEKMAKELGTEELNADVPPPNRPIRVVLVKKSRRHQMLENYIRYCFNLEKMTGGTGMYIQLGKTSNSAILEGEWFAQFQLRSWQQQEHAESHIDILQGEKIPAYRVYIGVLCRDENRIRPNCYPKDLGDDAAFMEAFPTGFVIDYSQVTLRIETGCGGTYLKFHERNSPLPVKHARMKSAGKEQNIHFIDNDE